MTEPTQPTPAASQAESSTATQTEAGGSKKQPVVIICIGMAGSGKTTFMQRLNSHLHSRNTPPYILNLDPAVSHMPYSANIDIRDTVDYKEVMKQYNLGPNGGILTALNLFTTKFDQVLGYVEKRAEDVDYILVDTPGQIEIFTWSASGAIITDAIASSLPTVVAYVVDTPRTTAPATFMSNMLYACSILYKTRLPFIIVFNKTDIQPHDFAIDWMKDFEAYQAALNDSGRNEHGETSYMNSLMSSMCLVLEEFYNNLRAVGVSAMTGEGMRGFFDAVEEARKEYESDYKPELDRLASERAAKTEADKKAQLERLMKDMNVSDSSAGSSRRRGGAGGDNPFGPYPVNEREDRYYDEEGDEEVDEEEQDAIRRQEEEEEEAAHAEELGALDVDEPEIGGMPRSGPNGGRGAAWPRPV
ncbi:XPA-binding protein 1 [Kwoniella mangroviensis CBS 10435]|uniref:GPN-loop GTPase n=1 Tax=Kwoniella mangroviensis CBS 10435 TaxID=1331196 RepID=A0A1B9IVA8_9TREE|nr:XPA-binding protein 1 [Kwoniella mangroviensis CBS 8507]OCF59466.1 XPA-binding protein 1 [Kwoniella mangroviensis CBS 10435]OCF66372.1 XPA-binding protein 1 [Kwoniella mangroviensis CBS 8507]